MAIETSNRFIPVDPPLWPVNLLPFNRARSPWFPFAGARLRWYFFGRNALWHGLAALALRPGDEILMPAYNHGVEVGAALDRCLRVRFYRLHNGLALDPNDIRPLLTRRTRAILVIHYNGFPQPLDSIFELIGKRRIALIEDCAQALFSRDQDCPLGSRGAFSIFCPPKTLPTPHGGLLALNDPSLPLPPPAKPPNLASSVTLLPKHLIDGLQMHSAGLARCARSVSSLSHSLYSPTNGQPHAAIEDFDPSTVDLGASALTRTIVRQCDPAAIVATRRRNYNVLYESVPPEARVTGPLVDGICPMAFPLYTRDRLAAREALTARGIQTIPTWAIIHPAISGDDFPREQDLREHVLEVPVHQSLSLADIQYVARELAALPRPRREG